MNEAFFKSVRAQFGPLNQNQVDGINTLLAATALVPRMHRAYILATAWHETASTMRPLEEYGKGAGHPYAPRYYGRGYVQLTWDYNYKKAGNLLGVDLVSNPEFALRPSIAAQIIVRGMSEGWFTGKKLSDFTAFVSMRRIVNGTDKAALIADYARKFENALVTGPIELPAAPSTAPQPTKPQAPIGLLAAIVAIIRLLFTRKPK